MLNRGTESVTEAALDDDLRHLLRGERRAGRDAHSVHRSLSSAQRMLGRFFFVHTSTAKRDTGAPERTYEFLHATFGDFLAARILIRDLAELAEEREHQLRRRQGYDAGRFHALTSFVTITRRDPLRDFCKGMLSAFSGERRAKCRALLLELLSEAGFPQPTWSLSAYEPERRTYAQRQAAFSANLMILLVFLCEGSVEARDIVGEPVADNWRRLTALWEGGLADEDRGRLWQNFRVWWKATGDSWTLHVRLEDHEPILMTEALPWPTEPLRTSATRPLPGLDIPIPTDSVFGSAIRHSAFLQHPAVDREHLYALAPLATKVFKNQPSDHFGLLLTEILVAPGSVDQDRSELYNLAFALRGNAEYESLLLIMLAWDLSLGLQIDAKNLAAMLSGCIANEVNSAAWNHATATALIMLGRGDPQSPTYVALTALLNEKPNEESRQEINRRLRVRAYAEIRADSLAEQPRVRLRP